MYCLFSRAVVGFAEFLCFISTMNMLSKGSLLGALPQGVLGRIRGPADPLGFGSDFALVSRWLITLAFSQSLIFSAAN